MKKEFDILCAAGSCDRIRVLARPFVRLRAPRASVGCSGEKFFDRHHSRFQLAANSSVPRGVTRDIGF